MLKPKNKITVTAKHKPTVSVGIPAYNEEHNIEKLVSAIYALSAKNFVLENVIVVSDGSTDQTIEIVKRLQEKYTNLVLSSSPKRSGKAQALNKIYTLASSDFLLTIDADVLPTGKNFLEILTKHLQNNPDTLVVGPQHFPTHTKTFWGKCAEVSYLSLEQAFLQFKHGNNMYAIMSAYLIRKSHYTKLRFPKGAMADQCYLYCSAATKHAEGFHIEKNAGVWFAPVDSFTDWRLLGLRSVKGDREDVQKYFGKEIIEDNQLPKKLFYQSLLSWIFKNPIHTLGSIGLNIFIRTFPLQNNQPKNGIWEASRSSKTVEI